MLPPEIQGAEFLRLSPLHQNLTGDPVIMKDYRYISLESDEIRLLELVADDNASELHGKLDKFRLPENDEPTSGQQVLVTRGGVDIPNAPPYEALSYTWGVAVSPKHSIKVLQDGELCQLSITPNLRDALFRIRKDIPSAGSRKLWVDAICMNQVTQSWACTTQIY